MMHYFSKYVYVHWLIFMKLKYLSTDMTILLREWEEDDEGQGVERGRVKGYFMVMLLHSVLVIEVKPDQDVRT